MDRASQARPPANEPLTDDLTLARTVRFQPAADYLRSGMLANISQVASSSMSTLQDGPGVGSRVLDLRVMGGLDVRLLPDRGFDAGAAWYRGIPLAWISAVGESGPLSTPTGMSWLDAFGGGLVTTCGLRNVGAPSEGHGLHGRFSHLHAKNVTVATTIEDGEVVLTASAIIDEVSALGPHLRVVRTIATRTGSGFMELVDATTNLGSEPEAAPLLYHVNIGTPLYSEQARLDIDSVRVSPRDGDAEKGSKSWMLGMAPARGARDMLFEHTVRADPSGWARAVLVNDDYGLTLTLCWDQGQLPRFHQWIHPATGVYVLGLEPANCSVNGRAADREANSLPSLAPDETRITRLHFHIGNAQIRH